MSNRIVFIHLLNNFSGSPRVLKDTIESLSGDQKYLLLTSQGPGVLNQVPNKVFFNYNWSKNKAITLLRFIYAQLYIFFYILLFTKKKDTIFINTMQPAIAAVAARIRGLPVIFHIHELHTSQKYFGDLYNFIRKYSKSKEIFVSEYIASKERLINNNSVVIHNPISKEFIKSARHHLYNPLYDGKFNVLMVCSLRDYKGVPEFLKLCNILKTKSNIKFTLVLDATKDEIDNYFKCVIIPENLNLNPRTDNPTVYYKNASLLLNLSRPDQWIESFGLTIVEAMAFGIPCIVPNIGGPKEIVDDKINGFQISCYDTKAIQNKIEELANNIQLCSILSENARQKSQLFDPNIYKTKMANFLINQMK